MTILPAAAISQITKTAGSITVIGNWEGKLSVSGITLRVRFHVISDKAGHLTATMDSPDQNATDIPVSAVTQDKDHVELEVTAIRGIYEGTMQQGADLIKGTWKQNGQTFPLDLERMSKYAGTSEIVRPQEPKPPYPYHADSISFQNGTDDVKLAGTLTYPNGKGPFPAVVLISGSGAQDRDETIMEHKPFLVIADYLTRHGIAVLRYDDRGVGESGGSMNGVTTLDLSNDVEAAVRYLSGRKMINTKEIGLIGHSEGGVQAILVANRDKQIKALVLLATPSLPGSIISVEQIENISKARGVPQDVIDQNVALQKQVLALLHDNPDSAQTHSRVNALLKRELPGVPESKRETMADNISNQLTNPWSRFYMTYDPRQDLTNLHIPVLALYGTKDLQVYAKTNAATARKALTSNSQAEVEVLKGLNHLFQQAITGLPDEYLKIQQTFDPGALSIIGTWLNVHLK